MSVDMEGLVSAYIAIRTARNDLQKHFEEQDAELEADMDKLESVMLSVCNDMNVDSLKTEHGTVMRRVNERYTCSDWDSFRSFVIEHQAVELFEKRLHQGNCKQFIAEHENDGLPPGVSVMREFGITVRKSSK
ncbi:MAG: hypothetical protein EBY29_00655 [Planctomycetes bacterium]|nr:hypothetical protein [Planctomycetota bacterium]